MDNIPTGRNERNIPRGRNERNIPRGRNERNILRGRNERSILRGRNERNIPRGRNEQQSITYTFNGYRFRLRQDVSHRFQYYLFNSNSVSLNVTLRIGSRNNEHEIETLNFIMTQGSRILVPGFRRDNVLTILDAVPMEFEFFVGKVNDAPTLSNMCTFSVGENAIFVDYYVLRNLSNSQLRSLLDVNKNCEIEYVDFPTLLTFFKIIFGHLRFVSFRKNFDVETCRKLVDLFQRFLYTGMSCLVDQFLNTDFYSATNLSCVFCTTKSTTSNNIPTLTDGTETNSPSYDFLWGSNFRIKYDEIGKERDDALIFQNHGLNWKLYTFIEKFNGVDYLGIGVIVEPMMVPSSDFEQLTEIEVTIRSYDARFYKTIQLSRNFNQYQSSAGCPVIVMMDEIPLTQDELLIFGIQARKQFHGEIPDKKERKFKRELYHAQSSVGCRLIAKMGEISRDHLLVDIKAEKNFNSVTEFPGEKDITLVIEGKKIVTSKNLLIHYFDYFKTLFESNFDDKNQRELVLHEVKYEDMYNMIDVIYNRSKSLTVNELEAMLILANRFFCPYITKYVDIAISNTPIDRISSSIKPVCLDERVYFAENYNQLVRVKESVKRAASRSS